MYVLYSLHFIPSLQSAIYSQSTFCSLQSASYIDRIDKPSKRINVIATCQVFHEQPHYWQMYKQTWEIFCSSEAMDKLPVKWLPGVQLCQYLLLSLLPWEKKRWLRGVIKRNIIITLNFSAFSIPECSSDLALFIIWQRLALLVSKGHNNTILEKQVWQQVYWSSSSFESAQLTTC